MNQKKTFFVKSDFGIINQEFEGQILIKIRNKNPTPLAEKNIKCRLMKGCITFKLAS